MSDLNNGFNGNELSPTLPPILPPTTVTASHEIVGIGSLLFVLIILITLFSSKLIELFKFHHINESTISIVFGMTIGIIITFFPSSGVNLFEFDSEFFFFVLLPPIVFEAGFSLKRKYFFRNMFTILMFAVIGTIISTLIIAFGLYSLSFLHILPLFNSGNPLECLLFAALISAVDPVGTLSVLGNPSLNIDATLYSLIFGESVLNDAVSIVLYKIFNNYSHTNIVISFESHFFIIIGKFCGIFIASFFIGLIVALFASVILKYGLHAFLIQKSSNCNVNNVNNASNVELQSAKQIKNNNNNNNYNNNNLSNIMNEMSIDIDVINNDTIDSDIYNSPTLTQSNNENIIYLDEYRHNETHIFGESPSLEFSIIILFAYLSYNLGEVLLLSGIVSVFSCGICMSHYSWYNLTWIAQISLHHIIIALSKCCENFVYAYLGISTVLSLTPSTRKYGWNVLLIIFTMILCILSRAANIFPLSALSNTKRRIKISTNMQIMMFFSGLRGAIAFALALNINTPHSDLIITTTLSIVILTTILCGCTTKYMVDKLQLNNKQKQKQKQHRNANTNININPQNTDDHNNYRKLNTNKNNNNKEEEKENGENIVNDNNNNTIETNESTLTTTNTSTEDSSKYYGIHKYWHHFDTNYMQMMFGGSTNPYIQHKHIGIYSNRPQIEST